MRFLAVVALALSFCGPAFAVEPYLFDLVAQPAYRTSLDRLLKPLGANDDFLSEVTKEKGNYLAFPSRRVTVEGHAYRVAVACEPRMDCTESGAAFLFSATGDKAWALLHRYGKPSIYLGNPTEQQKLVLGNAFR
jgi:hypothetical protein